MVRSKLVFTEEGSKIVGSLRNPMLETSVRQSRAMKWKNVRLGNIETNQTRTSLWEVSTSADVSTGPHSYL